MAKQTEQQKHNPFIAKTKNLPFHVFDGEARDGREPKADLYCLIKGKMTLGDKDDGTQFDVFEAVDMETGESIFITASYTIDKVVSEISKDELPDTVFFIHFGGKTTVKGKPFNKFDISICTLQEYEDYTN